MKIGVGLYGVNGHQIANLLENHNNAELVATAMYDMNSLSPSQRNNSRIRHHQTLDDMLKDERVELVSLCSSCRRKQAEETVRCLEAGKHVYAEKPCALTEEAMDTIINTSVKTGFRFHEMAGTAFEQPYLSMRNIVASGTIGEIVQVFAQKSYPYHDLRPQDEDIDGGLILQVGVHALRFIEHVGGRKVTNIHAVETILGNPVKDGGLNMAASLMMTLDNGGVASAILNYLNPVGFGSWGNEHLRIFGTLGFIESVDGGAKTRLIVNDKDFGEIVKVGEARDYFDFYLDSLLGKGSMPISLEEELHPTRMLIRAKANAIRLA